MFASFGRRPQEKGLKNMPRQKDILTTGEVAKVYHDELIKCQGHLREAKNNCQGKAK